MYRKIVIASDSFKGSLTSLEVAEATTEGIRRACPSCSVLSIAIADGGEGMVQAMSDVMETTGVSVRVHDPLGRHIMARYAMTKDGTAIMEMAQASGLTLLSDEERDPLQTSTYGTGEMILDALGRGCRRFIIGIGGSATNDGGTGMLEALGFGFIGNDGQSLKGLRGSMLENITDIDSSAVHHGIYESEFIIACDVDTPFCGPEGAAKVFASQKGADQESVGLLEAGMQSLCSIIRRKYGTDLSSIPGTGAAGGLGGAFLAFMNARLERGIDIVLDAVGFDEKIKDADLVITGEGKIDAQSVHGKVISGIAARAQATGVPVMAIAGIADISSDQARKYGLAAVCPIAPRPETESGLRDSMRPETAMYNITETVSKALGELSPSLFRGNL